MNIPFSPPRIGDKTIPVLKNNSKPLAGIIDYRLSTGFVLQNILGYDKVKYSYIKKLGYISFCAVSDIKKLNLDELKSNFDSHFKIPMNKKIKLYT